MGYNNNYDWHYPEVDCLGMVEMLRWFVLHTANWME